MLMFRSWFVIMDRVETTLDLQFTKQENLDPSAHQEQRKHHKDFVPRIRIIRQALKNYQ